MEFTNNFLFRFNRESLMIHMEFKLYELDRTTKILLVIWYLAISFVGGCLEAFYHQFVTGSEWNKINSLQRFILLYGFAFIILCIIPIITKDKEDILFVIGAGFLMQLFEDWSFWIFSYFVLQNWVPSDGFWSPVGFVSILTLKLPVFWFVDIVVAVIFLVGWYYTD